MGRRLRRLASICTLALVPAPHALGQTGTPQLPPDPVGFGSGFFEPDPKPCLTPQQRRQIRFQLMRNQRMLSTAGILPPSPAGPMTGIGPIGFVRLDLPILATGAAASDFGVHSISKQFDHDPTTGLLDYACGTRTYDGHKGTDFFSWPFPWNRMAADEVQIIAAAPGVILQKDDGNSDMSCAAVPGSPWNAVYVQHIDGSQAWYGHLKQASLTPKNVGDWVARGEYLGVMGSSGMSTGVHLHLTVVDRFGNFADPYEGLCDSTFRRPWWLEQRPYYDSAVNRIQVGPAPIGFTGCPLPDQINEGPVTRGAPAIFTAIYRDQLAGLVSQYRILRPDGSVFQTWNHSSTAAYYSGFYVWFQWSLPAGAPVGQWTFEVTYEGLVYAKPFTVQ